MVIFNDFKDPLLEFKSVRHQMTTIFEMLGIWAFIQGKMFLDLSFPLMEGGKRGGGGHDPVSHTNFNKIHASRTVLTKFHESRNST